VYCAKTVAYFPFKFLAQFSATVLSIMGIETKYDTRISTGIKLLYTRARLVDFGSTYLRHFVYMYNV